MSSMRTISNIFDEFGGAAKVAAAIGVRQGTAQEMKRRQSIPVRYWPLLVRACQSKNIKGLDYAALVAMHAPAPRKAAS